eukprot:jgi/Psemu1/217221/e_gw1.841.6.1
MVERTPFASKNRTRTRTRTTTTTATAVTTTKTIASSDVCNFCAKDPAALLIELPVLGRNKRAATPYCLSCYYTTSAIRQDPEKHVTVLDESQRTKQLPAIQRLFSECFLELQQELSEESARAFQKQKRDPLATMLGSFKRKRNLLVATKGQAPDPRTKQEGRANDGGFLREIDLPERLRRTQKEQEELQARQLARMNQAAFAARRASRLTTTTMASSVKKRRKGSGKSIWNLAMDTGMDGKLATTAESYTEAETTASHDVSCTCGSKDVRSFGNVTSRNQEVRKGEIWGTDRGDEVVSRFQCNRCGRTWNEAE